MGLTKFVLKRPVTTILAVLCLIVFGLSSVLSSKLELIPEMEMPMMVVFTTYAGASPEDVSELVTKPIEDEIGTLSGVKSVTSYSQENISMVLLEYQYGTDMDKAYNDLKKKTDLLTATLPEDAEEPVVVEFNINDMATMTLAVNDDTADNLYNYVNEKIVPEFEKISSVASVDVSGGQEQYVKVELIPEKMDQYHLTMNSLISAIGSADFSLPAGSAVVGNQELSVSAGVTFDTMESLKTIPITVGSGDVIHLEDVANIYSNLEDPAGIGRYNGKDTISLGIKKQQEASAGEVSKSVNSTIERLKRSNPNLEIVVVNDSSDSINSSLESVMTTMVMAVIISMAILYLFFGDVKASLIVGTSIPISILAALILMRAMGFSLNVITLGSLVLGVGMMVDNSINVLESCFRAKEKIGNGATSFRDAALEGTRIMIASILGGTATTCVVFLPLALIQGLSGQMFKPLGFTIVFCMVASFISAITVVPLCYTMYRPAEKTKAPLSGAVRAMQDQYRKILRFLLPKKKTVMFTSIALLLFSFVLATQIRTELMPATDEGTIQVTMELRPGLTVEKADEIVSKVEEYVAADPDVEDYILSYGASGLSISGGSSATITAYLADDRKRSTDEVVKEWNPLLTGYPEMNVTVESVSSSSTMASSADGVEYILQGTQYDELKNISDQITEALKQRPEVTKVHSTLENSASVIQIDIDPIKASAEGLVPAQVAQSVYLMISGSEATTLDQDGEEISVNVEYPDGWYETVDQVKGIVVSGAAGNSVALADIADIYFKDSPQSITRKDKEYQVTISGDFVNGTQEEQMDAIETQIYDEEVAPRLTENVTRAQNAMDESMAEEFASLVGAIAMAIFLVFVVMAAQFESPKFSLMVMTTIPFSLIGAFGLLFLADASISMASLLGFLMLFGTVVNSGILYVDTADQYRAEMDRDTALVEAGATRLRPILMTTLTTVVSMIPMAMAYGDSGETMQGLALVNVGGLVASTVLSLLMLPIYYTLMNRKPKEDELDVD